MEIYCMKADLDVFQFLIHKNDEDYINTLDREGKPFTDWQTPIQIIHKSKESRKKRKDFNVSNFFSGMLFMEENLAKKMVLDFSLNAQLLSIETPELKDKFVYVNLLGGVPAILEAYMHDKVYVGYDKISTEKTEYPPELDGKYLFDEKILAQHHIFRDKWINSFYFCTDVFKKWAEDNDVKGLVFENIGIVK